MFFLTLQYITAKCYLCAWNWKQNNFWKRIAIMPDSDCTLLTTSPDLLVIFWPLDCIGSVIRFDTVAVGSFVFQCIVWDLDESRTVLNQTTNFDSSFLTLAYNFLDFNRSSSTNFLLMGWVRCLLVVLSINAMPQFHSSVCKKTNACFKDTATHCWKPQPMNSKFNFCIIRPAVATHHDNSAGMIAWFIR